MSNSYYLQSAQGDLVIDIKDAGGSGSPLQAFVQKNEANQWWKFESAAKQVGYFHILSADQGLAVDIKAPVASGSALQAFEPKSEDNQLWAFVSAPGNTFIPTLNPPTTFIQFGSSEPLSFNISGTGFFPGRPLIVTWLYTISGGTGQSDSGSVGVIVDPTGAFYNSNQLPSLVFTGTLSVEVTDPLALESMTETANWDGTAWTVL